MQVNNDIIDTYFCMPIRRKFRRRQFRLCVCVRSLFVFLMLVVCWLCEPGVVGIVSS